MMSLPSGHEYKIKGHSQKTGYGEFNYHPSPPKKKESSETKKVQRLKMINAPWGGNHRGADSQGLMMCHERI